MKPLLRHLTGYFVIACSVSHGLAAEPKTVAGARAAYARSDKELNKVYQEVRTALPKAKMDKVRDDQRGWIEYRDYLAERQAFLGRNQPADAEARDTVDFWLIRKSLTDSRTAHLRAILGKAVPAGLSGNYGDSYGGTALLLVEGEKLHFQIEVVRGPTSHLGEISGVAKIAGQTAEFSDEGKGHDDGRPTILRWQFDGRAFELTGENTDLYHGARASFDGRYVKYGALTSGQAATLRQPAAGEPKNP